MDSKNALQIFSYKEQKVRTVELDGEVWFVAKDVCDILDIQNVTQAVQQLDKDERAMFNIGRSKINGGGGEVNIVNEPGVYALILRSRKPEAKEFSRWVRHDVLPSIRKHGAYLTPQKQEELITNPDFIIKLAQEIKAERTKVQTLQTQIENDKPKVLFAQSVETSKDCILIRELAKLLRQNGYNVGQNRLFAELRNRGFLIKAGSDYNMPTQKSMELGLMAILERSVNRGEGNVITIRTPKITGKGQIYFLNLFLRNEK